MFSSAAGSPDCQLQRAEVDPTKRAVRAQEAGEPVSHADLLGIETDLHDEIADSISASALRSSECEDADTGQVRRYFLQQGRVPGTTEGGSRRFSTCIARAFGLLQFS